MKLLDRPTGRTTGRSWLAGAAVVLTLGMSSVSTAQTPTQPPLTPLANLTPVEEEVLNRALMAERLLASFYNANANKPYLTGTGTATTPTTTNPPVVAPGITQPVTVTPAADPANLPADQEVVFNSTLSGGAVIPASDSSASGTARFALANNRRTTQYEIRLTGLSSQVTAVHLHRGNPGEPGGIIHHNLVNPVNGVSAGSFPLRPEELNSLVAGEFFIDVHTEQHPLGALRGQVTLVGTAPPGTTFPGGAFIPPGTTFPPTGTVGGTRESLRQMVDEFRAHHNAHVVALEQTLGVAARTFPVFENVDAPDLNRFLTMAQSLEEFAAGTHQYIIAGPAPGGAPPAAPEATPRIAGLLGAIGFDVARHAGALRAYRKTVSTAEGGDPNLPITEGGPFIVPLTPQQVDAFMRPFLTAPTTNNPPPSL